MSSSTNTDIKIWPLKGNDPLHAQILRTFLIEEARAFHTTVNEAAIDMLLEAAQSKRIKVLFVLAGNETVGCAVQFPSAIPQWDSSSSRFDFIPALYSEDMSVTKKGTGTPFMKRRVEQAASNNRDGGGLDSDGKTVAGALVGEQSWHETTAIGNLLKKFQTTLATDKGDTVLTLNNGISNPHDQPDSYSLDIYSLWCTDNTHGKRDQMKQRNDMFAVVWPTIGSPKIAATFSLGMSTFNGYPVVRVHMASNNSLTDESGLGAAVRNILETGGEEVRRREWLEDKSLVPLQRTFIHALGEPAIHKALKSVGATERVLGDFAMYPLTMNFRNIPPNMDVKVTSYSLLVPISDTLLDKIVRAREPHVSGQLPSSGTTRNPAPSCYAL